VSVLSAPFLLLAFSASRWGGLCLVILVLIGALESGFASMQSTLVLLAAPATSRGGAMGILSACIGTQPLGTLRTGRSSTHASAADRWAPCGSGSSHAPRACRSRWPPTRPSPSL